jgi:dihydroorotate dehydrogenase (NAD+) catalytic subunit
MIELTSHNPYPIHLAHPYVAAAGALGFGIHTASIVHQIAPAALITPSITLHGRSPDGPNKLFEHRNGLIYAEPWHDPGVQWVGRRCTPVWAEWEFPVIVSLDGSDTDIISALRELDQVEGIAGFEVTIAVDQLITDDFMAKLRRTASLPLIIKLPFADPHLLLPLVTICSQHQVDALTVTAPPRVNSGRMLTPAQLPITLYTCEYLTAHTTLPIMACGGINDRKQAQSALATGAVAVQFGSALLRNPSLLTP